MRWLQRADAGPGNHGKSQRHGRSASVRACCPRVHQASRSARDKHTRGQGMGVRRRRAPPARAAERRACSRRARSAWQRYPAHAHGSAAGVLWRAPLLLAPATAGGRASRRASPEAARPQELSSASQEDPPPAVADPGACAEQAGRSVVAGRAAGPALGRVCWRTSRRRRTPCSLLVIDHFACAFAVWAVRTPTS